MWAICGDHRPALLAEKIKALDETAETAKDAGPNYNVAPTTTVSTVVKRHDQPDDESTRRLRSMRWGGLVPPWAKSNADGSPDTKGPLLINARAETLTTSPAFRGPAKSKRCLVPMDGWYEWKPNPAADGKKATKTPFYMYAGDGEPLFMAGVVVHLAAERRGEGQHPPLLSCTIITTDAAAQLSDIHDRMPLTISEADWDRWLDPDAPIDEGLLRGHGIWTASRSARCLGW